MADVVRLEVEEGVATIRIDRPPMNAINSEVTEGLAAAAAEATRREDVGAVVIWGGEKLFAAGADVKEMLPMTPREVGPMIAHLQEVFHAIEEIPKVTIAAITGYCLGGGCELALCADLRFAAETARIGQPEILLGIIPGAGGTQRLPRLIGPGRAKELIFSGRHVAADEALAIGLVHEVHPVEDVYPKAVAAARGYARGPLVALRAAKAAVNWGARGEFRTGVVLERELFAGLFATEDQKAGMRALLEKQTASFQGR